MYIYLYKNTYDLWPFCISSIMVLPGTVVTSKLSSNLKVHNTKRPGLTNVSKSDPSHNPSQTHPLQNNSIVTMVTQIGHSVVEGNDANLRDFYIGLTLAISSSLFIGSSFIFKKLGLLRLATHARAGQGGYGYLREWLWWAGMTLMSLGEIANFAAYAFAPATLVTPLGALSVLVSALLASRVLKEHLNLLGKIGCTLAILGSTIMVIHSPKEQEVASMEELEAKLRQPVFLIYATLVAFTTTILVIYYVPQYGNKNVFLYIGICSLLGTFTVMGCKGLGVAMKQTVSGEMNILLNWLSWLLVIVVATCIVLQLNYLNRSLDTFNTAVVTPIYYVLFTSSVMVASLILFKEWVNMAVLDIIGNICGFMTIIAGIFLLNAFKDMNISLSNLPSSKKVDYNPAINHLNDSKLISIKHDDCQNLLLSHTSDINYNY
ncbi:magnesium transporter NIPA2 isoform X1 [Octopus bimaculoides]|nr:magnesium transporter NIPA2 isoform X1 [Octopus bimaculoides]|eukprot:XP_014780842.1 PREDICTED: magnesium transporter NIPA2-like isoform X1 [Octopus bimaculoides]